LVVVKAKLQLIKNVNSTSYYSKVAVLKDTVKKTKVVVLFKKLKDTVADKMGELVLQKMLMPRTMRTSFMEGELQVEYHLTRDKYTAAHKKLPLELN
jgi:hypothetical protein